MKLSHLIKLSLFGAGTILFRRKKPILGTIILTDRCNLHCRHCAVNNIISVDYSADQIRSEMKTLYQRGIRILFFCGGETFFWRDGDLTVRDLVSEAKKMGFFLVNVVTNGTFPVELPEADLVLLSLDGMRENHNIIRGDTFDRIMDNLRKTSSTNICFYMAVNKINKDDLAGVCRLAEELPAVRAVSFNFHTPYPGTEKLSLSVEEKKECCRTIRQMVRGGSPVFNLTSAFDAIVHNRFPTPCRQCVVMENGKLSVCGRCVDIPGLCEQCGYFFAAEYSLVFQGNIRVIADMLKTYLKYI